MIQKIFCYRSRQFLYLKRFIISEKSIRINFSLLFRRIRTKMSGIRNNGFFYSTAVLTWPRYHTVIRHCHVVHYYFHLYLISLSCYVSMSTFQSTLPGAAQSPVIAFGGSYGGTCFLFVYVYHCVPTKYECWKCCVVHLGSSLDFSKFLFRSAQSINDIIGKPKVSA